MFDVGTWPEWAHILRLAVAFLLAAGLGLHAYLQYRTEAVAAISPRRWMYWLYSAVFLGASAGNFVKLCVTLVFGVYERSSFHLGYSTLLLALSYVALLAGVRRTSYR